MSVDFFEPGRRAWASEAINWGIWSIPESELGALGPLEWFRGKDTIELGCGTGYVSAWLARLGARPVGIDLTPAQLDANRQFQDEFDLHYPLIEGSADHVPCPDGSFDFAISEYGASIWCDAYSWIPEAARLLKPGGVLVFLRNSPVNTICMPNQGKSGTTLLRSWFGMNRVEWSPDEPVEYHLPTGKMIEVLRGSGFEIEALIEIQAPEGASDTRFDYVSAEWSRQWPSEEIWRARKK